MVLAAVVPPTSNEPSRGFIDPSIKSRDVHRPWFYEQCCPLPRILSKGYDRPLSPLVPTCVALRHSASIVSAVGSLRLDIFTF